VRVVLDTNVLIAAYISRGHCAELLEHCLRKHRTVTSQFILDEFSEKLSRKFKYKPSEVRSSISVLSQGMEIVAPEPLPAPACRDPDDDWVLATAIAGRCECLVTGDKQLLEMVHHADFRIIQPRDFWEFERSVVGSAEDT
jgi:putative PIN family toxin of toxin-antitoxin system